MRTAERNVGSGVEVAVVGPTSGGGRGTPWVLAATPLDYPGYVGAASGLIGFKSYEPSTSGGDNKNTTSTTLVAIDTTNLRVTFVAPPSGKVLVKLNGRSATTAGGYAAYWGLLDGATRRGHSQNVSTSVDFRSNCSIPVSGLTPGTTYSFDWAWCVDSTATTNLYIRDDDVTDRQSGGAYMEVWAVNV